MLLAEHPGRIRVVHDVAQRRMPSSTAARAICDGSRVLVALVPAPGGRTAEPPDLDRRQPSTSRGRPGEALAVFLVHPVAVEVGEVVDRRRLEAGLRHEVLHLAAASRCSSSGLVVEHGIGRKLSPQSPLPPADADGEIVVLRRRRGIGDGGVRREREVGEIESFRALPPRINTIRPKPQRHHRKTTTANSLPGVDLRRRASHRGDPTVAAPRTPAPGPDRARGTRHPSRAPHGRRLEHLEPQQPVRDPRDRDEHEGRNHRHGTDDRSDRSTDAVDEAVVHTEQAPRDLVEPTRQHLEHRHPTGQQ